MVNVSNGYVQKSTAPGRDMWCEILYGDNRYTDIEVLSFEFNDVVHPEDMSFGTTCANRFHFEVWSRSSIPLATAVYPNIIFNGDAERCPLGEFYISRRYRKRDRFSITCYDKMYRLDSKYKPKVNLPCNASDVLNDIAQQFDFAVGFTPLTDAINYIPGKATCREIIGYIAGLNGGFAKFDRNGVLRLKKLAFSDFVLNRNQYMELSLKADTLEIRQVDFITDEETFSEGKGTKLTTYRQYNPFADKDTAKRVYNEWKNFTYNGMTVKMRGMPFLEAGDSILVQDDCEDKYYVALISDYTLEYDGGLTGTLISKSKNPIDDYEEPASQQDMLDILRERLKTVYFSYTNSKAIQVLYTEIPVININFSLESSGSAVFNSCFTATTDADCSLIFSYYLNNVKVGPEHKESFFTDKYTGVCLYHLFEGLSAGAHTLNVTARTIGVGGAVLIDKGELIATVSGQNMLDGGGNKIPVINAEETMPFFTAGSFGVTSAQLSDTIILD